MDKVTILSLVALLCCIIAPQIDSAKNTSKSKAFKETPNSRWQTPPEIVQEIKDTPSIAQMKTWSFDNGKIIIHPKRNGDYTMKWTKGSDKVEIHKFYSGSTRQIWNFGDSIRIELRQSPIYEHQKWDMGNTTMEYFNDKKIGDMKTLTWKNDVKDIESLNKYRGFISSWCAENASWVKADCQIYTVVSDE